MMTNDSVIDLIENIKQAALIEIPKASQVSPRLSRKVFGIFEKLYFFK